MEASVALIVVEKRQDTVEAFVNDSIIRSTVSVSPPCDFGFAELRK